MIIIPTYNERGNIKPLVDRIRKILPSIQILFVDDNSPDGTAEEIKTVQIQDKNIFLFSRKGKMGFASAYLDGFRKALAENNPDFIVTMDADLSHPPEKLQELIDVAKSGKIAVGSRYVLGGNVKNWSLKRKILSRLGNWYVRLLTGMSIRDMTSGFIAIPIEKLKQFDLGMVKNRGYAFLTELKVHLASLGGNIVEVPITFVERKEGESKLGKAIILEALKYPAKLWFRRQIYRNYPAWLIFFISFAAYVKTLPHTIFFGDSPEFMASAGSLGITHPPGYPTYVLIAKLFTFLPFGSVEFRVGLFSAVCASLSLVVFYFLFQKISRNIWAGFVAAMILGFSSIYWSQAIMAKIYMPFMLCFLLILLLIAKFWETEKFTYFLYAMFLFGFAATMHQMAVLFFFPLILIAVYVYVRRQEKPWSTKVNIKLVLQGAILIGLGLVFYLFLPFRDRMSGDFYNFAKIYRVSRPGGSLSSFVHFLLRSDYADHSGQFHWHDKWIFFGSSFENIWHQFYWLLIFVPIGLGKLWFTGKKFFVLTLGIILANLFGIILIRSADWGYENLVFYSYYYLPVYAIVALWIGLGIGTCLEFIKQKIPQRIYFAAAGLILILPVFLAKKNYTVNNLSNFDFVDRYTKQTLESLEPNAVLLLNYPGANTDTLEFGFHYQQIIKHIRNDVTVLTIYDIHPEVELGALLWVYNLNDPKHARYHLVDYFYKQPGYKDRPIYTNFLIDNPLISQTWTSVSNGLVYKFYPNDTNIAKPDYYPLDYQKDLPVLESDMWGQDLLAQYFYTQAAFFAGNHDLNKAQENFVNAIKYDYKPMGVDQKEFIYYRGKVLGKL